MGQHEVTLILPIAVIRSGEPVGYPSFGGGGEMDKGEGRLWPPKKKKRWEM